MKVRLKLFLIRNSSDTVKEDGSGVPDDDPETIPDHLYTLTCNGVPPHILRLKQGCVCSLMRNMSVRKGLVKNA